MAHLQDEKTADLLAEKLTNTGIQFTRGYDSSESPVITVTTASRGGLDFNKLEILAPAQIVDPKFTTAVGQQASPGYALSGSPLGDAKAGTGRCDL